MIRVGVADNAGGDTSVGSICATWFHGLTVARGSIGGLESVIMATFPTTCGASSSGTVLVGIFYVTCCLAREWSVDDRKLWYSDSTVIGEAESDGSVIAPVRTTDGNVCGWMAACSVGRR